VPLVDVKSSSGVRDNLSKRTAKSFTLPLLFAQRESGSSEGQENSVVGLLRKVYTKRAAVRGQQLTASSYLPQHSQDWPTSDFCRRRRHLRVGDQLWCRFAERNLVAHFLDSRSKGFDLLLLLSSGRLLSRNLLLLLRDGRPEFGDCALLFFDVPVLFQELVEQIASADYGRKYKLAMAGLTRFTAKIMKSIIAVMLFASVGQPA